MKLLRVIVCLCLGWLLWITTATAPAAKEPIAFAAFPSHDLEVSPFSDAEVRGLVAHLDAQLTDHQDPARWAFDADLYLQTFVDRLQRGMLSRTQETMVLSYLGKLQQRYPSDAANIDKRRRAVSKLTIGKTAPDIAGEDLDGIEFRLSDYRGSVVVLTFSGDWCGACRGEYPYHRLLLELYKDQPFALLGVSSDTDIEAARKAKEDRGLTYRMWWDGDESGSRKEGAIATTWGVGGWPTVYVLDKRGKIRFVNLRQEDLLKGVKQLMSESR